MLKRAVIGSFVLIACLVWFLLGCDQRKGGCSASAKPVVPRVPSLATKAEHVDNPSDDPAKQDLQNRIVAIAQELVKAESAAREANPDLKKLFDETVAKRMEYEKKLGDAPAVRDLRKQSEELQAQYRSRFETSTKSQE